MVINCRQPCKSAIHHGVMTSRQHGRHPQFEHGARKGCVPGHNVSLPLTRKLRATSVRRAEARREASEDRKTFQRQRRGGGTERLRLSNYAPKDPKEKDTQWIRSRSPTRGSGRHVRIRPSMQMYIWLRVRSLPQHVVSRRIQFSVRAWAKALYFLPSLSPDFP